MKITKTIIAALAATALVGCAGSKQNGGPTEFEGKFIGYGGEFVEFFVETAPGVYKELPFDVAEDGTFNATIQFDKDEYDCALFADRFMYRLCIQQGKHYKAEFDMTNGSETDFRFFGEGEKENLFMSHLWSQFMDMGTIVSSLSRVGSYEEFTAGIDTIANALMDELNDTDNKPFIEYQTDDINKLRTTYTSYYPFMRLAATGVYRPEESYLNAIKSNKTSDKVFSKAMESLSMNLPYMIPNVNLREALRAISDLAQKPAQKDEVIAMLISNYVQAGAGQELEDAYAYYKENVKNIDEDLCQMIENAMSLGPGTNAPEIEFEDIDGNVKHLADFQGKPLYIDLWASWCGPCCEEIPHLAKFVESLGNDPEIVCISISIDDNRNDWTAKLAEDKSEWPQFIATSEGQRAISKDYGVSGIPRFLLLNADGTIASVNADRPSDKDLLESLRAALK